VGRGAGPTPGAHHTQDGRNAEVGLPTREEAWSLLNEYTTKPGLIKHALAVEAGIRDGLSKHRDVETRREIRVPAWPTLESAAEEFRRIVCEIFGYPC